MAYTKKQLLDAFCRRHGYQADVPVLDEEGNPTFEEDGTPITEANPETQVKFLERVEREWAKNEAIRQLRREERAEADAGVSANVAGIEL